jgi:hypothetical protein
MGYLLDALRSWRIAHKMCPWCGEGDRIYSVYRDGGSTLYHQPCGRDKTWKNPDHRKNKVN